METSAPGAKESRTVFSSGGRDYTVQHVIEAAHFRGEIEPLWREFLFRRAAELKGAESETTLGDAAIDEAAVAFRYAHDLITAEETEAWLEARGLTLADFSDYFARVEWGKEYSGRLELPSRSFAEATAEERELFTVDLILSGKFDRMAERLAWRVAAWRAENENEDEDEDEQERELGGDFEELEAAYRRRCEQRLTTDALQRELGSVRLPLTRFNVELIELESRDAAREAFMCVRDDGMSMAEVAQEGRYPFRRTELVLEQIPDELQQKFLSLTPGSLLEPTPREDGYVLTRLLQKTEPKLDDPDVRQRVEQRILARHFGDLSSGRIQWRIMLNGAQ